MTLTPASDCSWCMAPGSHCGRAPKRNRRAIGSCSHGLERTHGRMISFVFFVFFFVFLFPFSLFHYRSRASSPLVRIAMPHIVLIIIIIIIIFAVTLQHGKVHA